MDRELKTDQINRRLLAGSESIAWELDRHFRDRLCSLVDQKMNELYKRRQDPEDIVQSVFKSFYARAANGEYRFENRSALWGLLQRIARNKMLKRIERDRAAKRDIAREKPIGNDVEFPKVPNPPEARVLGEALKMALDGLGSPMPEIFQLQLFGYSIAEIIEIVLRDLDPPYPQILQMRLNGKTETEIANELGCLRGKVRYQLQRLQHRLARMLGDNQIDELDE